MRSKRLLTGKREDRSRRRAARVLPPFAQALAVIAAAGMITAGCDNFAGPVTGYDGAGGISAPESGGGTMAGAAAGTKKITVKFEVLNGGSGLYNSEGIVSNQADGNPGVYDGNLFSCDFDVTITVPAGDEYLNIRWMGITAAVRQTYVRAKMRVGEAGRYTITLDYNGIGKVATKNLYDVDVHLNNDWVDRDYEGKRYYAVHD